MSITVSSMVGSKDKKSESANKAGEEKTAEELQDEQNVEIAGGIIRLVMTDLRDSGVQNSLIEILKTVRHWPSAIDKADACEFSPQFDATNIRAESAEEDDITITRVSFCYKGKSYDFVSKIGHGTSTDNSIGNIVLHQGGEQLIDMKIEQNLALDHYSFQDLQFIRFGSWIEKIVQIEAEIKHHQKSLLDRPDLDVT